MLRRRTLALLLTLPLFAACASGGAATESGVPNVAIPTVASGTSSAPGEASDAARQLKELTVTDRTRPSATYARSAFGTSWADTDGNGCNQRDDVLLRDAVRGTVRIGRQGSCDHDVLAGTWIDPYTGKTLTFDNLKDLRQAQAIQIDHVVPLAEAWVSGASSWSAERRKRFANDLGELLAVDGPANASKSASDPAAWRPKKSYQCRYAIQWISTKHHWALTVDPSELTALEEMLSYC